MEQQEFQKRLEELGRLAQEKENRLRTEEVREFLKDMELTEEQFQLVFAYLASRLVTVEGYVPAKEEREEKEAKLTPEEQEFLDQYRKELEYIVSLEEEELLELCRAAEEGDGGAKASRFSLVRSLSVNLKLLAASRCNPSKAQSRIPSTSAFIFSARSGSSTRPAGFSFVVSTSWRR